MHQRDRRRCDSGDAAGLSEGEGANAVEFFYHLAGEAGAGAVVEPVGDRACFVVAETLHGALLLGEVAGELDAGFYGLQLVADPCRDAFVEGGSPGCERRVREKAWKECGDEMLDGGFGALQELGEEVAFEGRWLGVCRGVRVGGARGEDFEVGVGDAGGFEEVRESGEAGLLGLEGGPRGVVDEA